MVAQASQCLALSILSILRKCKRSSPLRIIGECALWRSAVRVIRRATEQRTRFRLIRYDCRVGAASIDAVDRALNCVTLRWSVREGEEAADGGPPTVEDELPSVADVECIDVQPPLEACCMLCVGTMSFETRNISLTSTGIGRRSGFISTGSSNRLAT
jgi:hypothetical protein